jgi:hypothetical protein
MHARNIKKHQELLNYLISNANLKKIGMRHNLFYLLFKAREREREREREKLSRSPLKKTMLGA